MKKLLLLLSILLLTLALAACDSSQEKDIAADRAQFAADYEALNGGLNERGEPHALVEVGEDFRVDILDFDGLQKFLDSGSGVLYIGRPG